MAPLLALACSAGSQPGAHVPVLGPADDGTALDVGQDELVIIELDARPSTGFTWVVEELDPHVLAPAGREHLSGPSLGGLDRERLSFKGVAAGTSRLRLAYRKPWVAPSADDRRYTVSLSLLGPYSGEGIASESTSEVTRPLGTGVGPAVLNLCDPGDGGYGRCTPIKDQGECGACWAFATAAVFENLLAFEDPSARRRLSEQYLISCNSKGFTCDRGGNAAFDYYVKSFMSPPESTSGAVYASDFPYAGADVSCGSTSHPHHEKLTSWRKIAGSPASVEALKSAMLTTGPVWTAVCADAAFVNYRYTGHSSSDIFRGTCTSLNHAVVLMGWNDNGGDGYWLLRNSWGDDWGDRGYMRIAYGANGVGSDSATAAYGEQGFDNLAPTASAGADRRVEPLDEVILDGSASFDADGALVHWAWSQTGGATVELKGSQGPKATFVAPLSQGALSFRLAVTDDAGATSTASVTVSVGSSAAGTTSHESRGVVGSACSTTSASDAFAAVALLLTSRRRSLPRPRATYAQ